MMEKILVVGLVPYGYKGMLVEKYPNVIWFEAREVAMPDSAFALVELVKMMDGVMFMDKSYRRERLPYEILCALDHKKIYEKEDFPVVEETGEKESSKEEN